MFLDDKGEVVSQANIIENGDREKELFGIKLGEDHLCVLVDIAVDEDGIVSVSIRGKHLTVKEVVG